MKVRPIDFVPDVAAAVRFYEALGPGSAPEGAIVDRSGVARRTSARPTGPVVQIDEQDRELYT